MFVFLLYFLGITFASFLGLMPLFSWLGKNLTGQYLIKKDVWIYMWFFSLSLVSGLYFFLPDFNDTVFNINYNTILMFFGLSAFIYIAFLMEINWLFYLSMAISSALVTWFLPSDIVVFENNIPLLAEKFIIFTVIFAVTFFARILNGMSAIFGIFALTVLLGICVISLIGGLPISYGILAAGLSGMCVSFLKFNWYPSEIALTDGACSSAGFLLACFILCGVQELAGPSLITLLVYLAAEILWVLVRSYIMRIKEPEFYNNTAYFTCYYKDVSIPAILVAISKIGLVNIIFAAFQIYAINPFSVPLFTLVVDLWLLNILLRANDEELGFKQVNKVLIDDIKDGLKTIGNSFKKGKE